MSSRSHRVREQPSFCGPDLHMWPWSTLLSGWIYAGAFACLGSPIRPAHGSRPAVWTGPEGADRWISGKRCLRAPSWHSDSRTEAAAGRTGPRRGNHARDELREFHPPPIEYARGRPGMEGREIPRVSPHAAAAGMARSAPSRTFAFGLRRRRFKAPGRRLAAPPLATHLVLRPGGNIASGGRASALTLRLRSTAGQRPLKPRIVVRIHGPEPLPCLAQGPLPSGQGDPVHLTTATR